MFVAEARYIPSESIMPTLQINDRLSVDKHTLAISFETLDVAHALHVQHPGSQKMANLMFIGVNQLETPSGIEFESSYLKFCIC